MIYSLGELVGEVLSDFPNESAFESSIVKIQFKKVLIFEKVLTINRDHLYRNCFESLFSYDCDGVMVRMFATESSNTSSNPVGCIFFLLFKCFMFDLVLRGYISNIYSFQINYLYLCKIISMI